MPPVQSALGIRRLALIVAPALAVLAGALSAQAVPGGFGLLVWAGMLLALSYVLRRFSAEPAATPRGG